MPVARTSRRTVKPCCRKRHSCLMAGRRRARSLTSSNSGARCNGSRRSRMSWRATATALSAPVRLEPRVASCAAALHACAPTRSCSCGHRRRCCSTRGSWRGAPRQMQQCLLPRCATILQPSPAAAMHAGQPRHHVAACGQAPLPHPISAAAAMPHGSWHCQKQLAVADAAAPESRSMYGRTHKPGAAH